MAQDADARQPIVWVKGQTAGTDSAGLWNLPEFPDFLSRFFKIITHSDLEKNLAAVRESGASSSHILILEGCFTNNVNEALNALIKDLVVVSRAVILLGNHASYGTLVSDGFMDLERNLLYHVETPFIKLPGTPVHARHLLGTLNHLILYGLPDLDIFRRPQLFYSTTICEKCQYRSDFEAGHFVRYYGEKEGCLYLLGCKGPITKNSCPIEKWNGTSQWCIAAGSPCTGCSEPDFPLHHGLGMFGNLSGNQAGINSFFCPSPGNHR